MLVADKGWSSSYIHILFQRVHEYSYSSIPFLAQVWNYKMINQTYYYTCTVVLFYNPIGQYLHVKHKVTKWSNLLLYTVVFILQSYWSEPAYEINLDIHTWTWFLLTIFPQFNNCCIVTGNWLWEEPFHFVILSFCHSAVLPYCILHKLRKQAHCNNVTLFWNARKCNWTGGLAHIYLEILTTHHKHARSS